MTGRGAKYLFEFLSERQGKGKWSFNHKGHEEHEVGRVMPGRRAALWLAGDEKVFRGKPKMNKTRPVGTQETDEFQETQRRLGGRCCQTGRALPAKRVQKPAFVLRTFERSRSVQAAAAWKPALRNALLRRKPDGEFHRGVFGMNAAVLATDDQIRFHPRLAAEPLRQIAGAHQAEERDEG